jgi:hypothetical protein
VVHHCHLLLHHVHHCHPLIHQQFRRTLNCQSGFSVTRAPGLNTHEFCIRCTIKKPLESRWHSLILPKIVHHFGCYCR